MDPLSFRRLVEECKSVTDEFERKLSKVQDARDDRGLGKAWKRVKLILMKDDFQSMWDRVHHQVEILTLQLNILQRFAYNYS